MERCRQVRTNSSIMAGLASIPVIDPAGGTKGKLAAPPAQPTSRTDPPGRSASRAADVETAAHP
jgi:hypothetical protein